MTAPLKTELAVAASDRDRDEIEHGGREDGGQLGLDLFLGEMPPGGDALSDGNEATEPSTPIFHPWVRRKFARASSVINMRMTERACAPSWKPNEAERILK